MQNRDQLLVIIAVLLGAILAVMLYGAEQVKSNLQWLFWLGFGLLIVYAIAAAIFQSFLGSVAEAKAEGLAWRYKFFLWPGVIGCIIVYALAGLKAGTYEGEKFRSALDAIPYWGAPFALVGFAFAFRAFEGISRTAPKAVVFVKGLSSEIVALAAMAATLVSLMILASLGAI
jgi:hypothetical protein